MVERVIAACDGAAKGNPGPAAWAYVVADGAGAPQRWRSGALGHSTNNVGELTALRELLADTDPAVPLEVRLDSTYTRDSVTKWLKGWKRNGWKTAAGKPVANQELIQGIDALLEGRDVTFVYVPAHQVDGDPLNAIADKAASDAARTQRSAGGTAADLPVPDPAPAAARRATRPAAKTATRTASTAKSSSSSSSASSSRSGGTRTLAARFPGTCPCSRPYAKGDKITKVGASWGHPECAAAHA
ncbi:ribonuclease H family protein [Streptomyces rubellomurinus]|uniref:Ribonuclease H n=1 Tax=Streptomyces rubellomurinus (strain ATCC 31215) TaxID=359131 RepID=A0A0F2TED5_STRR3|nr:ribonuclease H [Streptomyces rubellomurinus]KJS60127.1 ribonuclease HI [Streptomyces rubellomurinus]